MKTGTRTLGPASLKLSYSQQVAAHLRGGLREISHLLVKEDRRNQGHASDLMRMICREADENNIMLMLMPQPFDMPELSKAELRDWYSRRFGFTILQETPTIMIRQAYGVRKLFLAEAAHG